MTNATTKTVAYGLQVDDSLNARWVATIDGLTIASYPLGMPGWKRTYETAKAAADRLGVALYVVDADGVLTLDTEESTPVVDNATPVMEATPAGWDSIEADDATPAVVKASKPKHQTVAWRVEGPGGTWSIWDFGDELTVQDGPDLLSNVVSRIREDWARRLTPGDKRHEMERAAGAIHTAKILGADRPTLRGLWSR